MKSSPISARPVIEMATVVPAKMTARPAVAPAAAAATWAIVRRAELSKRVTMNSVSQMPTPRPIIGTRISVIVLKWVNRAAKDRIRNAPITATMANAADTVGTKSAEQHHQDDERGHQADDVAQSLGRRAFPRHR